MAKIAPLATALGMAGNRQFDSLVQTYMLPRVSPTVAVMLVSFLAAQTEYKNHFDARQQSAGAAPPEQPTRWVRIDDPNAKFIAITKPDAGKIL